VAPLALHIGGLQGRIIDARWLQGLYSDKTGANGMIRRYVTEGITPDRTDRNTVNQHIEYFISRIGRHDKSRTAMVWRGDGAGRRDSAIASAPPLLQAAHILPSADVADASYWYSTT